MSNLSYSFLDTQAAIVGPGGAIAIGAGAGVAEEGITIEPAGDLNTMTVGADGEGMHTLIADKSGTITLRLLKTSPTNAMLAAMLAFQRTSARNHGQNTITVSNTVSNDAHTCQQVAFAKVPVVQYAKNPNMNEWTFHAIKIDLGFGKGS